MRVLLLTDYFRPHIGGVENVVEEVAGWMARMGHRATVLTMGFGGEPPAEEEDRVSVVRFPGRDLTRSVGLQVALSLRFVFRAPGAARREKPQVINANNLFYSTSLLAPILKRILHVPLVTTVHLAGVRTGSPFSDALIRAYEVSLGRAILRESDAVIAVSCAVAEHLVGMGVPAEKVFTVPNGVDFDFFTCAFEGRRPREFEILFLGRLVPNKGLRYFIEAARALAPTHPRARFVVIGNGPDKAAALEDVRKSGLAGRFEFLDSVPDVRDAMKSAYAMARPSLSEGMPLTVLEAMASGVPVVAFSVAGTPEVVANGETGILVPPADSQELARALARLMLDPQSARRMGDRARASVRQRSWRSVAEKTLDVYATAAGRFRH